MDQLLPDMEDSDDLLPQEYGRFQQNIGLGGPFNLADLLNTLLQHHGLPISRPQIQTAALDVALFFATHPSQGFNTKEPTLTGGLAIRF